MQTIHHRVVVVLSFFAVQLLCAAATPDDKNENAAAVQFDVKDVLNTRVITVVKDGAIVPLRDDIDGAGGLATAAASELLGNKNAHPLPDNPTFPATKRHPQVVLNYANENATDNQARRSVGEDTFFLPIPERNYDHLYLFLTSGRGASKIIVKMVYTDSTIDRRELEIPDWYWDLKPDDSYRSYLVDDLGKWDKKNKMVEAIHHAIFCLDIVPSPGKTLAKIAIHKNQGGLMVFYGATGTVATKRD